MVDLGEWVSRAKVLLVEVESGLCDSKHKLVSEEFDETLTDKDSLRYVHGVIILEYLVGTGADRVQVA